MALWIFGMVAVAVAFGFTYWGFIRTVTGQSVDESALVAAVHQFGDARSQQSARVFLDRLLLTAAALTVTAVAAAALRRRSLVAPAIALGAGLAAIVTTQLLKEVFLSRPDLGVSAATVTSFPSGHTTTATAAMVVVMLVASPRLRPYVGLVGGLFAAGAGVATYVLGWHRPADVVGAYLVAAFWGLLGGLVLLRREPEANTWSVGRGAPAPVALMLAWVPGVVGTSAALAIGLVVLRAHPQPTEDQLIWYLVAALCLVVGSAMLLFALAASLFTHQTARP